MRLPLARIVTVVALVFALTPTVLVLVASFSGGSQLSFPPSHPSLSAYGELLSDASTRVAIVHSLVVAVVSVLIAVPIGLAAAFALDGMGPRWRGATTAFLQLGIVTPLVVSGVGFLVLFTSMGWVGNLYALAFAIAVVNLPFVVAIVGSSVEQMDPALAEAARTLGAEKVQTFLLMKLPQVLPSVVAASLLLFVFGATEFLVSLILTDSTSVTLPVFTFSSLRSGLTPRLAAVGGVYIVITVLVVLMLGRARVLSRFLSRSH